MVEENKKYYISISVEKETKVVPAGPLDNILFSKTNRHGIEACFYDFINGEIMTPETRDKFYQLVVDNAVVQHYPTTDHLITHVRINALDVSFLYVSLDNSVKSNTNGLPLHTRLPSICQVLNKIIKSLNNRCIIFFSEACRPSFFWNNSKFTMEEFESKKKDIKLISWEDMKKTISDICHLTYCAEQRTNKDDSDMSFGISTFCCEEVKNLIQSYHCHIIMTEGFGSSTVGVKMTTGEIVWGIHFPVDHSGKGAKNLGSKTMVNLQNLMKMHDRSICAFGDFNTIPGNIADAINQAISPEFEFMFQNELTFFGAFYDFIPVNLDDDKWVPLVGLF